MTTLLTFKKSLKIPKGQSESVYRRRTDNTMAKRKSTEGQTTIHKNNPNFVRRNVLYLGFELCLFFCEAQRV